MAHPRSLYAQIENGRGLVIRRGCESRLPVKEVAQHLYSLLFLLLILDFLLFLLHFQYELRKLVASLVHRVKCLSCIFKILVHDILGLIIVVHKPDWEHFQSLCPYCVV